MYTHTHMYIYIYTHTHIYVYIYIYIHTHTHIYEYIYTHTHIYINIHTHTHTHIYVHIYIYIYIHTHTEKNYFCTFCYIITEWFFLLILFINYILSSGLVGLWTIRLSADAGAHIEYSLGSHAEDTTITNVKIKTPDWKWDWGVDNVMPRSEGLDFWWFLKKELVEIWLWASPVHLGAMGCAARLLGQWVEIWFWVGRVQLGVGCGRCRNGQHSKNCVSLSLLVSKNTRS